MTNLTCVCYACKEVAMLNTRFQDTEIQLITGTPFAITLLEGLSVIGDHDHESLFGVQRWRLAFTALQLLTGDDCVEDYELDDYRLARRLQMHLFPFFLTLI